MDSKIRPAHAEYRHPRIFSHLCRLKQRSHSVSQAERHQTHLRLRVLQLQYDARRGYWCVACFLGGCPDLRFLSITVSSLTPWSFETLHWQGVRARMANHYASKSHSAQIVRKSKHRCTIIRCVPIRPNVHCVTSVCSIKTGWMLLSGRSSS